MTANPFDMLHTLMKGLGQSVAIWTALLIDSVRVTRFPGERVLKYSNNLSILDKRLKNFPRKNSATPCGEHM